MTQGLNMDRMSSCGGRPVKVYRAWWSVAMMSLPPVGLAAVFLYALFAVDVQWWFWVLMLSMVAGLLYMSVTWLRHVGDRIEVFDRGLHITWAERRREGGKWAAERNVWLEWRDIKAFRQNKRDGQYPFVYSPLDMAPRPRRHCLPHYTRPLRYVLLREKAARV